MFRVNQPNLKRRNAAFKACPKAYEGTPRVRLVQNKKQKDKTTNLWLYVIPFFAPGRYGRLSDYYRFLRSGLFYIPHKKTRHSFVVCRTVYCILIFWKFLYFAVSNTRFSRMMLTLICPGYSSSSSIFFAISCAIITILSSLTTSGRTRIRTSLPA